MAVMTIISDNELITDPNCVKVVVDKNMNSLLFSRSAIPFARDKNLQINYYQHIGVYAFRKNALIKFTTWPITPLEAAERIECLRYLEHGVQLKMVITEYNGVSIDTPGDLDIATSMYKL